MIDYLRHLFGHDFRHSLKPAFAGMSISTAIAWIGSVPWAVVFPLITAGITSIGGAVIGIRTHWKLAKLKVEAAEIEVAMLRRKLKELPVEQLRTEEVAKEVREMGEGPPS